MGDNGFSSTTFGLAAAGFVAGDAFAGSRMLLSALVDFNCDEGTTVDCWNLDMDELTMLSLADGTGSGFAADDAAVGAGAATADFSAMATFSFILARRMLLLVEADDWAAIFFRVDDAVAYLEWVEVVVFVAEPALFKP